jgi:PAS domain S-box-containing protein
MPNLPDLIAPWLDLAIALSAVCVIIGGILKWVVPAVKAIQARLHDVKFIAEELRPNGGQTVKDKINNLDGNVSALRHRAEKIDARQWAIVSSLNQPTWESDAAGMAIRANASLLELIGRGQEDLVGNGWSNILAPEDAARVWREWTLAVKQLRTFELVYDVINVITKKRYRVRAVAVPYFDSERKPHGWIGVYNDVTEITTKPEPVRARTRKARG